jgi:hypothetical protein
MTITVNTDALEHAEKLIDRAPRSGCSRRSTPAMEADGDGS